MNKHRNNDIIKCMVVAIESYGFFVTTEYGFSGLVHISEISNGYVKDINNFVTIGDTIYCQIIEVIEEDHQVKLSIKNINYKSVNSKDNKYNSGFLSLKKMLPYWIEKKLKEYESENID